MVSSNSSNIVRSEKLEVFDEPIFDDSLLSLHEHTYKPYGSPQFNNSDEVRIAVNFQDLILDIANSYLYIEGSFTPTEENKVCYLKNNALAFLFDEIRYLLGGEQITLVRKPGITTTLKTMASFGKPRTQTLITSGWGLNANKQYLLDVASHTFSGKLPLSYLMGFAEDYSKGLVNVKHELVLIIARNFKNSYHGEVDANIKISKIEWKIRHIVPEDRQKLKILSRMKRNAIIKVPYRMWDLYELPALRQTSSDVWSLKTSTNLEKPRYVIIAFQNIGNYDNRQSDPTAFTHANVSDIRLFLNSSVYPYERWNLNFNNKLYAPAYYAYERFQTSYYNRTAEPLMDYGEFLNNPIFVIDCSHQADALKTSTVDIKIEFETREQSFPANIKVYALIFHDAFITYNSLDGTVNRITSL